MNNEILWNLVNAGIAGSLVFLGGCSTGKITLETFIYSGIAGLIAGLIQFKDYWAKEEGEYTNKKLMQFI